ncbi:hypothetical protein [Azovibrio restrictus]|uniref:hypothetical protein n=1 Tax=Azovibrio restrictus TaxID=146938 RepID=UPI0003F83CE8|nr:hypothetical protein [Azovibrio restrictus]
MNTVKQKLLALLALAVGLMAVSSAQAASVLTADMTAALGTGLTQMQDTTADLIAKFWPYMLGIMALITAPKLLKKFWNTMFG